MPRGSSGMPGAGALIRERNGEAGAKWMPLTLVAADPGQFDRSDLPTLKGVPSNLKAQPSGPVSRHALKAANALER
jgi:hypothetical protein